jgi:hypothetical protein
VRARSDERGTQCHSKDLSIIGKAVGRQPWVAGSCSAGVERDG